MLQVTSCEVCDSEGHDRVQLWPLVPVRSAFTFGVSFTPKLKAAGTSETSVPLSDRSQIMAMILFGRNFVMILEETV